MASTMTLMLPRPYCYPIPVPPLPVPCFGPPIGQVVRAWLGLGGNWGWQLLSRLVGYRWVYQGYGRGVIHLYQGNGRGDIHLYAHLYW